MLNFMVGVFISIKKIYLQNNKKKSTFLDPSLDQEKVSGGWGWGKPPVLTSPPDDNDMQ